MVVLIFVITRESWLAAFGRWMAYPPSLQTADVIVVLGGRAERGEHAIELYRRGLAPEIWITGGRVPPADWTSFASPMRARAVAAGVPPGAIHVLNSESTWEDGREIAALAQARHTRSLIVVTNWTHSRRALCVIRQHLSTGVVQVYYDPPPEPGYEPEDWWRSDYPRDDVLLELVKMGGYFLRYGLNPSGCL